VFPPTIILKGQVSGRWGHQPGHLIGASQTTIIEETSFWQVGTPARAFGRCITDYDY